MAKTTEIDLRVHAAAKSFAEDHGFLGSWGIKETALFIYARLLAHGCPETIADTMFAELNVSALAGNAATFAKAAGINSAGPTASKDALLAKIKAAAVRAPQTGEQKQE